MKTIYTKLLMFVVLALTVGTVSAQVTVTATLGSTSSSYSTLSAAFGNINNGTHQGDITITISASTTEPAGKSDTLYSSGQGSASYTSVYIKPTADGITITGTPATGRGVIELFGSDNVTIDGDNPNTSGTNRNLTVVNGSVNSLQFTSVIRLLTSTLNANLASADNNTFKNCVINGNAVNGDTLLAGANVNSFGIYAGTGGSTALIVANAATAPSMSSTTSGVTPTTNNLVISNNKINSVSRGIGYYGNSSAPVTASNSVTITNNYIGSDTSLAGLTPPIRLKQLANSVYVIGIFVQGTQSVTVSNDTVQNISTYQAAFSGILINSNVGISGSFPTIEVKNNILNNIYRSGGSSLAVTGISVQSGNSPVYVHDNSITNLQCFSAGACTGIDIGTGFNNSLITRNKIYKIYNTFLTGNSIATGIRIQSANDTISNNFVSDILNAGSTAGTTINTSNGAFGISTGVSTIPTNCKIYNNSVYMTGSLFGTGTAGHLSAAFMIWSTSGFTGWDVRNNIFFNNITGGTSSIAHVSVALPAATSSASNLTLNNNAYYCGSASSQGVAATFTPNPGTFSGMTLYSGANFNANAASPASTNFKIISKALSTAGSNDNASFANNSGTAPFNSLTDLSINSTVSGAASQLESGGAAVGAPLVTTDINGTTRPANSNVALDMGAVEFNGTALDVTAPVVSFTAFGNQCDPTGTTSSVLSGVIITDVTGVPLTGSLMPRIYYKKGANGSYTSAAGTKTAGTANNGTWSFTIDYTGLGMSNGDSIFYFVVAQDAASSPNVGTTPIGGVYTDVNTVTSNPTPKFFISRSLSGTYLVGAGKSFPNFNTLDAAIKTYNTSCLTGAVTFSLSDANYFITSDTILANSYASSTNTLTIKPTQSNTTITGVAGSKNAVFLLYGADYVTIDGSIGSTTNSVCSPSRASRDLTIANSAQVTANTGAVVWLCNTPSNDPATNNKIINCNITGAFNSGFSTYTQVGIGCAGPGTNGLGELITTNGQNANWGNGNINNQYINDSISLCTVGVYTAGASAANKNTGTVISQIVTGHSPNNLYRGGISANFEDGITVTGNTINFVNTTALAYPNAAYGIALGYGPGNTGIQTQQVSGNEVTNATVSKNIIDSIYSSSFTGSNGTSTIGILLSTGATGTSTIANNRISNYAAYAPSGNATDFSSGIHINGGAGNVNIYNNTISATNVNGGPGGFSTSGSTYGFSLANNAPIVNLKNNIIAVSAAGYTNRNRAIGLGYALASSNLTSNNNSLFASVGTGASASNQPAAIVQTLWLDTASVPAVHIPVLYTTLSAWQAASSQDANSVSVAPVFVSSTDLHLSASGNCALSGAGATGLVSDDIDCTTRTTNDIGADEFSPSVTVSTATTSVCSGVNTTFTATATNAVSPSYQWKKNGSNVGTNSSTYSDAALANTDVIACVITISGACTSTATSNNITMTVNSSVTPSVAIATATTSVCSGNSVAFTATGTNPGSSPVYTWKKNGSSVGSGSSISFPAGTLTNGDIINCTLTANNTCQTTATAISNNDTMTVKTSPAIGTSTGGTICNLSSVLAVYNSNPNAGVWSSSNTGIATVTTSNGSTGLVTGVSNGTATLTYTKTSVNGCVSSASTTVIVAMVATPNAITGTSNICRGGTTQLSSTTSGGVWSASPTSYATINSTGLLTSSSTGTSLVKYKVTNSNGCTATANYTVTINALPNVPTISYAIGTTNPQYGAGGAFCTNKSFTVVGFPSGGVWSKTGVISVTSPAGLVTTGNSAGAGTLTYTYTNSNGCSSSRTIAGNVAVCAARGVNGASSEQLVAGSEFTMYPNPARSFVSLSVKTLIGEGQIIITDLMGKQVKMQALTLGNNTLDITTLGKGFYFVSVITNEGKNTKKLIVE